MNLLELEKAIVALANEAKKSQEREVILTAAILLTLAGAVSYGDVDEIAEVTHEFTKKKIAAFQAEKNAPFQ